MLLTCSPGALWVMLWEHEKRVTSSAPAHGIRSPGLPSSGGAGMHEGQSNEQYPYPERSNQDILGWFQPL